MDINNINLEYSILFKSNNGNFDHQPIFNLVRGVGLTGDDFISLYRLRRASINDASITAAGSTASALIGLTYGDKSGLTSLTGNYRLRSYGYVPGQSSLTADWGSSDLVNGGTASLTNISTTSAEYSRIYNINLAKRNSLIDLIIEDTSNNISERVIQINNAPSLSAATVLGIGIRPIGRDSINDTIPTGELGKAEILTYLYNQMQGYDTWHSAGLTGLFDSSYNSLSASLEGKAAGGTGNIPVPSQRVTFENGVLTGTISGWTLGPTEGGFRLDGGGFIKSVPSELFKTRHHSTTGMTVMGYVRLHSSGSNQSLFHVGDTAGRSLQLRLENGELVFSNGLGSITAGVITSGDNSMAGGRTFKLNRWYHIAGKITATGSDSGMSMYINGEKAILARTLTGDSLTSTISGGGDIITALDSSAWTVAMDNVSTTQRLFIGDDSSSTGTDLPFDVGLTRIFTRPLTDNEVFINYISTIPSNSIIKNIKVG